MDSDIIVDQGAEEAERHGHKRSSHWPKVEHDFLLAHPRCAACYPNSPTYPVQVHHVFPFHYVVALGRPDLELDPRNLITLCETRHGQEAPDHHLMLGHLANFKSSNVEVGKDIIVFRGLGKASLANHYIWQALKAHNQIKPLDQMTQEEKDNFRALMDSTIPLEAI